MWSRCRDAHGGSDAIKSKGTEYLPMLEGMAATESVGLGVDPATLQATALTAVRLTPYAAYLKRAMFYPAMGRTVLGLIGLLFSKAPTPPEDIKEELKKQLNDVTLNGTSLHGFAVEVARELLITGRVGILVDYAIEPATVNEDRPYWVLYRAEDIINWRVRRIGGRMQLTMVVLREQIEASADEFDSTAATQFRVLRLDANPDGTGRYNQQVYRENPEKKNEYLPEPLIVPMRRGEALNFIPFQICGPTSLNVEPEHPPLVDLADVNISHFRTSADREHGAHFTALPTPWVKGHTITDGSTLGVGAGTAWVFPNENASAGMLEFSGAGLASLKDIMEEKRLLMATLGARMLETQKNTQEAAQTVAMRHAGEGSALGIMADTEGKALTNVCKWHLYWSGLELESFDEDQTITLNPELLEQLTTEDISKLVAAWQAGAISYKTLYYNLQWGEWTRPDVDADTELEDIEDEEPDEPAVPPVLPGEAPPPMRAGDEALTPEERAAAMQQRRRATPPEPEYE
jgi:hypothetical protein